MVFSDPSFLFYFLPVALLTYWIGAWRFRNFYLLAISFMFYAAGGGMLVFLLLATSLLTFLFALAIDIDQGRGEKYRKNFRNIIVGLLLTSLVGWKYLNFITSEVRKVLLEIGIDFDVNFHLVLPIAISFYTFQCISYVIDVSRKEIKAERNIITFLCYILLFPHLLAGPVVRFADVSEELSSQPSDIFDSFVTSCPRFFWGLAKKVLIADQAAQVADAAFGIAGYQIGSMDTVIGVLAYSIQIYFDFSGYSDMAIGLAGMFGIRFQENFRRPYSAVTVTDFWRRWHISLSTWFRDYVYIPLGGSRRGAFRTYRNLSLVFVLTGFWHGANWTFLLWGITHGFALILERLFLKKLEIRGLYYRAISRAWTILLVMFGWLIFRSDSVSHAGELVWALGGGNGFGISPLVEASLTPQRVFWISIGALAFILPGERSIGEKLSRSDSSSLINWFATVSGVLASIYVLSSSFSPFLYFQF
jgi:alginate O-acetyltransferase complex protein AlgI